MGPAPGWMAVQSGFPDTRGKAAGPLLRTLLPRGRTARASLRRARGFFANMLHPGTHGRSFIANILHPGATRRPRGDVNPAGRLLDDETLVGLVRTASSTNSLSRALFTRGNTPGALLRTLLPRGRMATTVPARPHGPALPPSEARIGYRGGRLRRANGEPETGPRRGGRASEETSGGRFERALSAETKGHRPEGRAAPPELCRTPCLRKARRPALHHEHCFPGDARVQPRSAPGAAAPGPVSHSPSATSDPIRASRLPMARSAR